MSWTIKCTYTKTGFLVSFKSTSCSLTVGLRSGVRLLTKSVSWASVGVSFSRKARIWVLIIYIIIIESQPTLHLYITYQCQKAGISSFSQPAASCRSHLLITSSIFIDIICQVSSGLNKSLHFPQSIPDVLFRIVQIFVCSTVEKQLNQKNKILLHHQIYLEWKVPSGQVIDIDFKA